MPWPVKEAVAAAVSQSNACPYCVKIHAAIASVGTNQPLASLLFQGRITDLVDPSLRAILTWAESTRSPGSTPLLHHPFTASEAPEIIGTTLVYHYINRLVQVFLLASLLPSLVRSGWVSRFIWRLIGSKLASSRERERTAGASLLLSSEYSWAAR